jgi:hypothetical protein
MVMDPSAHPQHMHIVKHLVHAYSGCENHSRWVYREEVAAD